ncbi:hypothetical protein PYW07_014213 [Mythimna separata]|uniref:N-acetyltransferase domain-containing protein n=1 Tax=Mythimna separata TaxID=271217 RepID=A0AAD7Z0V3_MYTSE|nr:hypothetical protein PYW07_014213 [Mythimna separata]
MGFKRVWDSSCPRVWDKWESDGTTWVIRDLPPEDDEEALNILVENLCPDEALCMLSNLIEDQLSVDSMKEFWRGYLSQRMSLACYEEKNGKSKLVALNVCLVICEGEKADDVIEGEPWKNVYGALKVAEDSVDAFKYLGIDKILYALGLVVTRDYRGAKLGSRILAARKPLSLFHGIKGTSTVFTGPASQISAARAGFETIATITLKDLADAGLNYPRDDSKAIKVMVKKFE